MTQAPPPYPQQQQPLAQPSWATPPQQPAPPQAQSWSGAQQAPWQPGAPAPARRNPLGLVAVLLAGVALLLGVVAMVVQASAIATGDFAAVSATTLVVTIIRLLVTLAGVALGIVGVLRRDAPHTLAAIGLGACGAIALGLLLGFLNVPINALLLG